MYIYVVIYAIPACLRKYPGIVFNLASSSSYYFWPTPADREKANT